MSDFESILQKYMAEEGLDRIPGVILLAADRDGEIIADYAAGIDSIGRDPPRAYTKDTISRIHSMTKLVTAIAALQCIERGLLTLDEDISKYCPEWKEPQVIESFDGDEPILRKAKGFITMRMLLSHSSGLIYERSSKLIAKWFEIKKIDPMDARSVVLPLIFDPGESWAYGAGCDWAGFVIEKATGMRLNDWMTEHIFKPLNLPNATFRLDEVVASGKPLADLAVKKEGEFVNEDGTIPHRNPNLDHGGGGIFCSASEYLQILLSVLKDDGKLLKSESVTLLFEPQLKNPAKLQSMMAALAKVSKSGRIPIGVDFQFALGGLLNLQEFPGRRGKNSLEWSGLANLFWWIDRETGLCACMFEQILPFGHSPSVSLLTEFEKHVYEVFRSRQKQV